MYAEKLLELARKVPEREKDDFVQNINRCFEYVNTAALVSIEIEMGNGNISEIERFNDKRNRVHDKLCEAINNINNLAKELKLERPFEFELEPMEKNGRFAGYSQDNHHRTSEIASVVIDELQYLGRETYRNLDKIYVLEDAIHQQAMKRDFKTQNYEQLMESMEKYNTAHYQLESILENLKETEAMTINLRDGAGSITVAANDQYSLEIIDTTYHDDIYEMYLEGDMMQDCPKSIIRDIINEHQGFEKGQVVELELETKQEQKFDEFDQHLNDIQKELDKEISDNRITYPSPPERYRKLEDDLER